jgi:hypothetical protein
MYLYDSIVESVESQILSGLKNYVENVCGVSLAYGFRYSEMYENNELKIAKQFSASKLRLPFFIVNVANVGEAYLGFGNNKSDIHVETELVASGTTFDVTGTDAYLLFYSKKHNKTFFVEFPPALFADPTDVPPEDFINVFKVQVPPDFTFSIGTGTVVIKIPDDKITVSHGAFGINEGTYEGSFYDMKIINWSASLNIDIAAESRKTRLELSNLVLMWIEYWRENFGWLASAERADLFSFINSVFRVSYEGEISHGSGDSLNWMYLSTITGTIGICTTNSGGGELTEAVTGAYPYAQGRVINAGFI